MQEVHSVLEFVGFFEWPAPSLSVVCLVWLTSLWDSALFGFLLNVESRNIFLLHPILVVWAYIQFEVFEAKAHHLGNPDG